METASNEIGIGGIIKNSLYAGIEAALALWVYTKTQSYIWAAVSSAGLEALRSWIKSKFDLSIL